VIVCWYSPADVISVSVDQQEAADWHKLLIYLCCSSSCCHWLLMETHQQVHAQVNHSHRWLPCYCSLAGVHR